LYAAFERITDQDARTRGVVCLMRGEAAAPPGTSLLLFRRKALHEKKLRKNYLSREFDEKTSAVISMQTEKLDEIGERAAKIEQGVCECYS